MLCNVVSKPAVFESTTEILSEAISFCACKAELTVLDITEGIKMGITSFPWSRSSLRQSLNNAAEGWEVLGKVPLYAR